MAAWLTMMRGVAAAILFITLLSICATPAPDDRAVTIFFIVRDNRTQAVSGLKASDIIVTEDGQPQQLELFEGAGTPARAVALLIDRSGTRRHQLPLAEEGPASHFFSSLLRSQDRGMVVSFAQEAELLCDLTDDRAELERAVGRAVAKYAGGSAPFDAIHATISQRLYGTAGVKHLIIITDGNDNASRVRVGDVVAVAHRNHVSIHVLLLPAYENPVGLGRPGRPDKQVAEQLTGETGGSLFELKREASVEQAFLTLAAELRNAYAARYVPTNPKRDGGFRRIKVKTLRKDLRVQASRGYFAPQS